MIPFSTRSAYLLLVAQEGALIGDAALRTKFEEEIICSKELRIYIDIIVEKLI